MPVKSKNMDKLKAASVAAMRYLLAADEKEDKSFCNFSAEARQ